MDEFRYSAAWAHDALVRRAKLAPDRAWMELYFRLIRRVLDATGLESDDPRLHISLPGGMGLPVTINTRYVLAAGFRRKGGWAGFIYGPEYDFDQELQRVIGERGEFSNNRRGARSFEPAPYWLTFKDYRYLAALLDFEDGWLEACRAEVTRYKASPFLGLFGQHKAVVCRAVNDLDYQREILDEAFGASAAS